VALFDAIGVGQWFRYVTGAIEVWLGRAVPRAFTGAVRRAFARAHMVGAIETHLFIVGVSPVPATLLLIGSVAIAWVRRDELARALSRLEWKIRTLKIPTHAFHEYLSLKPIG